MSDTMTAPLQGGMQRALLASMRTFRRSAPEQCRHGLIAMTRSAKPRTPKSKPRRQVFKSGSGAEYVLILSQKRPPMMLHLPRKGASNYAEHKDRLTRIKKSGLARRAWGWGARQLRGSEPDSGNEIPGVVDTEEIQERRGDTVGVAAILNSRLSYLDRILPADFQSGVETATANWLLHNVQRKLGPDMGRAMEMVRA